MAHGYLNHFAEGKAEVFSAGVETHGVNPKAIEVMNNDGLNISHHTSNNVNEYYNIHFDFIITVCDNAKEHCPFFPSKAKKFHQNFPDPAKADGTHNQITDEFIRVRDMIKEYSKNFINDNLNE